MQHNLPEAIDRRNEQPLEVARSHFIPIGKQNSGLTVAAGVLP
jgi:hypothetical protein